MKIYRQLTIFLFLSVLISQSIYGQDSSDKLYIGCQSGIFVKKYCIAYISDSTAYLETYVKWQGVWIPTNIRENKPYQPEKLILGKDAYKNDYAQIYNRKNKWICKVKKTFTGKLTFTLNQVNTLPEQYNEIRKRAIDLTNSGNAPYNKIESLEFNNWINNQ